MKPDTILTNATVIADPGSILRSGTVAIADGRIIDVDDKPTADPAAEDLGGAYLIPGLIELHTDTLERHVQPRSWVLWDPFSAAVAHDGQIVMSGITTVFDALAMVGGRDRGSRHKVIGPMVEGLTAAAEAGTLRATHFIHLRCEVPDPDLFDLMEPHLANPLVRFLSIMDHTPGQRQFADLDLFREIHRKSLNATDAELDAEISSRQALARDHAAPNRARLAKLAQQRHFPVASHDDETPAHVREAAETGAVVSEFPTTLAAAEAAREHGMKILMGAPNLIRGGSHTGNISAGDLAADGLLDILSSDYIPISLLAGAMRLTQAPYHWPLEQAIATVTATPADVAGLIDRGRIAPGKRADIVIFDLVQDRPIIRSVWAAGKRVA